MLYLTSQKAIENIASDIPLIYTSEIYKFQCSDCAGIDCPEQICLLQSLLQEPPVCLLSTVITTFTKINITNDYIYDILLSYEILRRIMHAHLSKCLEIHTHTFTKQFM